ncbi:hypothetical protein CERZMDRAFT_89197 [Cercospora zeae-maydis SCOH1-5]|uniref:Uncharacterized protein n=1 Tax=Cercospora zeae-maydis SCOH1-5 TaxID=717836 RepID=A0A6A6F064_9PEZI|nr:hypothetical protein CERZMDRAFT_89197 [Cercospora zeae-maydis SCOH1-5]
MLSYPQDIGRHVTVSVAAELRASFTSGIPAGVAQRMKCAPDISVTFGHTPHHPSRYHCRWRLSDIAARSVFRGESAMKACAGGSAANSARIRHSSRLYEWLAASNVTGLARQRHAVHANCATTHRSGNGSGASHACWITSAGGSLLAPLSTPADSLWLHNVGGDAAVLHGPVRQDTRI